MMDNLLKELLRGNLTDQEIDAAIGHCFVYRSPKGDQVERYQKIREAGKDFAFEMQRLYCEECNSEFGHLEGAIRAMNAGSKFLSAVTPLLPENSAELSKVVYYAKKAVFDYDFDHVRTAVMWANAAIACNE